jgi:hypothetical protein
MEPDLQVWGPCNSYHAGTAPGPAGRSWTGMQFRTMVRTNRANRLPARFPRLGVGALGEQPAMGNREYPNTPVDQWGGGG